MKSLIKKRDECANNPKKFSTTRIDEHILCEYLMSAVWIFDHIENKHTLFCGRDSMKKNCEWLREHTKNIINSHKKHIKMQKNVIVMERES